MRPAFPGPGRLSGRDGPAILPLPNRREWVMLTHPIYRASPCRDRRAPSGQGAPRARDNPGTDERPEGGIYIVPVSLETSEVPQRLSKWRRVDLLETDGYQRLVTALNPEG